MKLQIIQTIKQGLEAVIKNPIILTLIIIHAVLNCIFFYFFIYGPKPAVVEGVEMPFPVFPEHFGLYLILFTLVSLFLILIICKMVYDAVKSNVSISEAVNLSARKFVFIFIALILYSLIVLMGFIALIIPGIFLSIKFVFVTYFILLNNEKIIDSFKKSWQITKGNWWRIFGLYLIFLIPITVLSGIAMSVALVSIPAALFIDFVALLLSGWLISAFTIAYIQLTGNVQ